MRWHKARYRCREQACPRQAFTESISELPPGTRITGRCRRAAGAAAGSRRSVAAVTAKLPMSWPIVHAAFVAHADRLLTAPAAPAVLGIDETRRGRPRWARDPAGRWRRLERFETNFVDLAGAGRLLGQTAGHTGTAVVGWLDTRGQAWKDAVQVVAMDPCAGYRAAVEHALPHTRIIVDHFHLTRLANQLVTKLRQRVSSAAAGSATTAWAHRRLLLRAGDRPACCAPTTRLTRSAPPGRSRNYCASC